jgi:hypothetical protein
MWLTKILLMTCPWVFKMANCLKIVTWNSHTLILWEYKIGLSSTLFLYHIEYKWCSRNCKHIVWEWVNYQKVFRSHHICIFWSQLPKWAGLFIIISLFWQCISLQSRQMGACSVCLRLVNSNTLGDGVWGFPVECWMVIIVARFFCVPMEDL